MKTIDEYYATPIVEGFEGRKFFHLKKEIEKDVFIGEYISYAVAGGQVDVSYHNGQFRISKDKLDRIYQNDYYTALLEVRQRIK